jgi:uncharacterized protein YndB with AHSA1/START domain
VRIERGITIDAPPEAVFAVIANPEEHLVWRPLVVEFRPLDEDLLAAGGTVVETVTFFGRRYTTVYEVEELDPPHTLALRSLQGPLTVELGYALAARDEGTQLVLTLDAEPPPRFPFFGTAMRWYLDDGARRLKALIEEDRAPVPRWFNLFAAVCIALFAFLLTLGVAYTAIYEDPVYALASGVAALSLWIVSFMLARGRPLGRLR